jgi:glycosyltransferase involved in cell wall biosynthesis
MAATGVMVLRLGKRSKLSLPKVGQLLFGGGVSLAQQGLKLVGYRARPYLFYLIPGAGWVTDWVGHYVTREIRRQFHGPAYTTTAPHLLSGQIVHFGEVGAFLASRHKAFARRNQLLCTYFHGSRDPQFEELARHVELFLAHENQLVKVVTACTLMALRLQEWGVSPGKIVCLPLGIDLKSFRPGNHANRLAVRRQLAIPETAFCVGSFQKDGVGWGDGLQPKWIKGPDLFLEVIAGLYARHPNLYVLLTGPARGYVKAGLQQIGVPYQHHLLNDYQTIVAMYHALDAYLISSREEGGPKAVLESLATAVPLVSTRVGMAPDLIQHQFNGLLADVDDVPALTEQMSLLIESLELRRHLAVNGLQTIQAYDWPIIAARYYHDLYEPLFRD